jgi:hypothetical protein
VAKHSVAAGDPIAYAAKTKAQEELLEAAEDALEWFERFDAHAPEGLAFGGEAKVRRALRTALRKAQADPVGDAAFTRRCERSYPKRREPSPGPVRLDRIIPSPGAILPLVPGLTGSPRPPRCPCS